MSKFKLRNKYDFNKKEDIVTSLLKARGISDIQEFLSPSINVLNSAYLLGEMGLVVARILSAIKNNERICISADPDSDGVCSTAIMVRYISKFTNNYYISYAQRSEGHGIEYQLEFIDTKNTDLLIILDSSTNSTEACEILSKSMNIIILDHHDVEEVNPYAYIVNPKNDKTYPNKNISGAGVVYKVIQALDERLGSGEVGDLIDLVAVGMYADMMPMDVLENRHLVIQGMKNIKNPGLLKVLEIANVSLDKVNSQTIGFTISPLLNGCARKDKLELGIELLICDDDQRCTELVMEMRALNDERRQEEKILYENYLTKIDPNDKVLIAIDENASKNFNGLIANKFSQEFHRPAIVMREHEGSLAGSYRGFASFDMKGFLNRKEIRKYLKYALGHPSAGGVGLKSSNFKAFKEAINKALKHYDFNSDIYYDYEIDASLITPKLVNQIQEFDYCSGQGFPPAMFYVREIYVEDNEDRVVMGKNRDTVKIKSCDVDVIKFKTNENWASDVGTMDTIDVVGQLSLNEWIKWNGEVVITTQVVADSYLIV
jgi:single-stranded-DNA-specific exonuclease